MHDDEKLDTRGTAGSADGSRPAEEDDQDQRDGGASPDPDPRRCHLRGEADDEGQAGSSDS